ncbi:hypothetical protein D3C76_764060 [compost metagenome]
MQWKRLLMRTRPANRGFTLIEVLIALVILAVGLLGMASLMMSSLQSSQGAYLRSQASLLAFDIVERMRANHAQAISTNDYTLAENATGSTDPDCKTSGCNPAQQAQQDLHDWRAALADGIPGAKASITRTPPNEYEITISWEETGTALKKSDETEISPSFSLRVDL